MSEHPLTERERKMMDKYPILRRVMEREYYGFQNAREALELKRDRQADLKLLSEILAKYKSRTDANLSERGLPKRKEAQSK
jgi:hypothetical protein